ncbi:MULTISPECIES: zinc uptake transcriptional repressor Zur [unclassified Gilliamella]|uniref:zinc uptake transcriptional repressor Zur n=1 Tax=unclassified Gilliamella TaxID=2685620 RepID=UPI00081032DE|nr:MULTISPECIES: zinc uptake transcriptional repressor Zur [Gilliamella]MCX8580790.1 zinc uptake transcriptional repressor Zur [Gilliamella sp. B3482]MCX8583925.1 zinc uptake transcriptional repressor Zur [Gilliamella sp. B3372]MCX8585457.1 zinc uptake transcriptional repressor Zur [Gilliamella sp. B3562]MCX8594592.1 zinc uptake transcriptional repressor Zur [Gilliamella sp. B3367]MCX8660514.1 zinc uptake transcriptional repressor Zur [Gilliamella sp. B2772]
MHNMLIEKIETLCKKRGIKLTTQRKTVLDIMLKANKAMSAYDLLDLLKVSEPQAKPPTIYRALEFLLEQGFIHKVESTNCYIICPHFQDPQHISILFICDNCQQIIEKHSENIESQLKQLASQSQFLIKHSVLEIHGICHSCQP